MGNITKDTINGLIETIQNLYLADDIPWMIGYSGGKDSTAALQLVWIAIEGLSKDQWKKPIHIMNTDTLVESPIVAKWVEKSLDAMQKTVDQKGLPFIPERLTPKANNSFWVNLLGRGYPFPRQKYRWCTDRLKIQPVNNFIKEKISEHGEIILVLGTRKAESARRARTMDYYEKKRVRELLSPNPTLANELVFSPLESWTDDDVWVFLLQYKNPWGYSNNELLTLYRGATADNECPLMVEKDLPSCGKSRFGCWVCTMVEQDKSMAAMIANDDEKEWMTPLLDRIIGFKLSKLLQSKIKSKSAGRVQSVALRLIVERENEIRKFKSEEYWTLAANIKKDRKKFVATLNKVDGKKADLKKQEDVDTIIERCKEFEVSSIEKKVRKREPKMPFITSTLQQEASTKLNFGAKKTMQIAQKLYEGLPLAGGINEGLISYMRTDSTRLSEIFVTDAEKYIEETYGKEYRGRARQKNSENAQDAHEAIRPTNILNTPERMKEYLTNDQYKLYKLIYARTLASLMAASKSDVVNVQIVSNGCEFSANGSVLKFDGYLKVYGDYETVKDEMLPELIEKEKLINVELEGKQHFTEPPLRYSEARLIKEMEEKGIGRPSTYAIIIDTLQARGYVSLERPSSGSKTKVFIPSEQGELTDKKLKEYFEDIINVSYTANMEHHLDEIAAGNRDNIEEVRTFYEQFEPMLQNAYEHMEKKELERTGEVCPECGSELVYRIGRYGKFISCINFPTCRYTKSENEEENVESEEVCPKCGSKLVMKKGRYGSFLACSNYPECKYIKSNKTKEEPVPTGEMCPECGHELVQRKSRFGTTFIGCSNYPKCRYIKKEKKKTEEHEEEKKQQKK